MKTEAFKESDSIQGLELGFRDDPLRSAEMGTTGQSHLVLFPTLRSLAPTGSPTDAKK